MLSPAQRYEIGKRAAEHDVTASLHYYAKKYPELPLKETSVQKFKNLYVSVKPPLTRVLPLLKN